MRVRRSGAATAAATLAVVAATLLAPALAAGHGGTLLGSAQAGPYRVQLMATAARADHGGAAIDYTAYVQEQASGRPVEDARVTIAVTVDGRRLRRAAARIGNGYEVVVPVPDASDVSRYAVQTDVRAPGGSGTLAIAGRRDGGPPLPLLVGSGVLLAALVALALRRRRALAGGGG
ncbi:hypothetical protein [Patulibacter defluvii]|uniref:hypothetical protein n=1 Tax=Patulibacter defluvii TaxID=3095358 RepID=UPI002A759810|nr:hypothetical protein [Patulibacter sp. DM4]